MTTSDENGQRLIFTNDVARAISAEIAAMKPSSVFVITDENVDRLVMPGLIEMCRDLGDARRIVVKAGDTHKNIESLTEIWRSLVEGGANRRSVVVNIGGGVVTDMGGFAAATFKRGVRFINVPTTLLSAVDAAVGGKTGINFDGLKNEVGAFCNADAVIISTCFFATLPHEELLSGYAEMLKHGLISGCEASSRLLAFDILSADCGSLLPLLEESVMVKKRIVEEDPTERGLRKALNLGHTPGHAFESWALAHERAVPHGYAVAWGLVVDLVLSHMQLGFPSPTLHDVARFVADHYGAPPIDCSDYPELLGYMRHDKKNIGPGDIRFTLLQEPGAVKLDAVAGKEQIEAALDIFRDLLHI